MGEGDKGTGQTSRETETEWLRQKVNCKAGAILLYMEGGKEKVGL